MTEMRIVILVDDTSPPSGRVQVRNGTDPDGSGRGDGPFSGWLGLLHALSEALQPEPRDA